MRIQLGQPDMSIIGYLDQVRRRHEAALDASIVINVSNAAGPSKISVQPNDIPGAGVVVTHPDTDTAMRAAAAAVMKMRESLT